MRAKGAAPRRISFGGRLRLSVVVAVCFGAGAPTLAQTRVEGEVLDAVTGLPIEDVVVHFPELRLGTITDSLGYFAIDAVPGARQLVSTFHIAYEEFESSVPLVAGEVWVLRLTPRPIRLEGIQVEGTRREEIEARRQGWQSEFIGPEEVAEAAARTNKLLEVMRSKAPPRLQIRQGGGHGGITFCIQSTRRRPSVQDLRELGDGCRPALLALDGVIVYAPPPVTEMASMTQASLPSHVARMLLDQDPNEIESIRILSPSQAFFRYGEAGRLGAVEIKSKHPGRPRGKGSSGGGNRSG
ncbi:MAG: hypothetical protein OXU69_09900 [Gemmatimonadota bacterium]|nr:hypothetical protein [Gemmatimonadota bacterium]MDE2985005.1 hypothetical protein [Gemmatimonadota bacterium]